MALWFRLPKRSRRALVFAELGFLTVADPRLHSREVPTITIDELIAAAKVDGAA